MDAEFVLKNASIIEGSGLPPYKGHINIKDGEIKAVQKESSKLPKKKDTNYRSKRSDSYAWPNRRALSYKL